jgi:hypothetical protein
MMSGEQSTCDLCVTDESHTPTHPTQLCIVYKICKINMKIGVYIFSYDILFLLYSVNYTVCSGR